MTAAAALVFDLDDTLYPESAYAWSGFDAVAAAFEDILGPRVRSAERMRRLFDTPDRARIFNAILRDRGIKPTEDLIGRMVAAYRSHVPNIELHSDAEAALRRLHGAHKLGLLTDGFAVAQHAKIDALGLRDRLDAIIVTDDWGREFWKPNARAFEEMGRTLATPAERCTYVADNPAKDFIAPNALGWTTIQIKRPDGVHATNPAPDGGEPQRIITTLDELE
jgi:putative hydrolase of the HAD superfamily